MKRGDELHRKLFIFFFTHVFLIIKQLLIINTSYFSSFFIFIFQEDNGSHLTLEDKFKAREAEDAHGQR